MKKTELKISTLAQQCYDQLQEEIINGVLKPGEKLKVEPIKQRMSIGQSPIREALSRLAASGLVDMEDNKGFRVARISESDIRDIYATFTVIENLALAQAIERGDDAWEAGVVAALHQLALVEKQKTIVSYEVWAERNYAFHVALINGCNSPMLMNIRRDLYRKFDRYCRMAYNVTREELSVNHKEHKKLAEAALQRDVHKAQELMTYHLNGAREAVIETLKESNIL